MKRHIVLFNVFQHIENNISKAFETMVDVG